MSAPATEIGSGEKVENELAAKSAKTDNYKNNTIPVFKAKKDCNKSVGLQPKSSTTVYNDPVKKVKQLVTKAASSTGIASRKQKSPKKLGALSTSKKELTSVGKRKRIVSKSSPVVQSPKRNPLKAKCRIDFSLKPDIKFSSQTSFPVSAKKSTTKHSTMGYSQLRQAELELRQKYEELERKFHTMEENHKQILSGLEDELRTAQGQVKDLGGEKNELKETLSTKDAEYTKQSTALRKKLELCENRLTDLQIDPVSLKSLDVQQHDKENINERHLKQREQAETLFNRLELFTQKANSFFSMGIIKDNNTLTTARSEMNYFDGDVVIADSTDHSSSEDQVTLEQQNTHVSPALL